MEVSETMLAVPEWTYLGDWPGTDLMSNIDHAVDQGVAAKLRSGEFLATYPGWNFNATCWFADGQFHAAVHVYHEHVATLSAETPEDLMGLVCDEYGDE